MDYVNPLLVVLYRTLTAERVVAGHEAHHSPPSELERNVPPATGDVDCVLYNDDGTEMQRIHMGGKTGVMGVNIPQGMYHTVEVRELAITFTGKQGRWSAPDNADIL